jgi:hypothetical protein
MRWLESGLQRIDYLGHHWTSTHVPTRPGLQWAHVLLPTRGKLFPQSHTVMDALTMFTACRYRTGVPGLPAIPTHLDPIHQRPHLLQRSRPDPASKHK